MIRYSFTIVPAQALALRDQAGELGGVGTVRVGGGERVELKSCQAPADLGLTCISS